MRMTPEPPGLGGKTLTSSVYERLRHDILHLVFQPGEKLRAEAISGRYEVGATPIREALNRLAAEGLVTQADKRGFRVADVSLEALHELTRTRCAVNELALREAIRQGDQRWEEGVLLAYHRLSRAKPDPGNADPQWSQLHRDFHSSLIAGCKLRWLIVVCEWLFDQADRYRHIELNANAAARNASPPERGGDNEHRAIMEATLARNADEAVRLLNDHFLRTANLAVETGVIKHESPQDEEPLR